MHVVVVGCGRVGSTIAKVLHGDGHDVVVVDRRVEAFTRLGPALADRTVVGVGFDRDVLAAAGTTADSAVLAVTSGDNSNILIARVARETFGVARVVARIYDPRRAAIYERLGIPTVASVAWTSARAIREVMPGSLDVDWTDSSSRFVLVERRVPAVAAGHSVAELDDVGLRVALITRAGEPRLPVATTLLQQDDLIHVIAPADAAGHVENALEQLGGHR